MAHLIQPRPLNLRKTVLVGGVVLLAIALSYCPRDSGSSALVWRGGTMGTAYSVKAAHSDISEDTYGEISREIDAYLTEINRQMSTYIPDSEINAFNRSESGLTLSTSFVFVVRAALDLAAATGGAFDPTVAPLVDAWGFGPDGKRLEPGDAELNGIMRRVGFSHIRVVSDVEIGKDMAEVSLDLNAIAKGYAVDGIAGILSSHGLSNHLVEIGGEVRVHGSNSKGSAWTLGIDAPIENSIPGQSLWGFVQLSNAALATSGGYRNLYKDNTGAVRAHIIDPRTGQPADHSVASVSVMARTCFEADAMATALYVMGAGEGLEWVESKSGVEALFIVRRPDGSMQEVPSSGFVASGLYRRFK
ncbi:MAG: FAD:protein FMN transferase [Verrucomicrobia bacterium]|nr:FAD:protein FMN transferase [Verrucomicrobiota bacterium]